MKYSVFYTADTDSLSVVVVKQDNVRIRTRSLSNAIVFTCSSLKRQTGTKRHKTESAKTNEL